MLLMPLLPLFFFLCFLPSIVQLLFLFLLLLLLPSPLNVNPSINGGTRHHLPAPPFPLLRSPHRRRARRRLVPTPDRTLLRPIPHSQPSSPPTQSSPLRFLQSVSFPWVRRGVDRAAANHCGPVPQ